MELAEAGDLQFAPFQVSEPFEMHGWSYLFSPWGFPLAIAAPGRAGGEASVLVIHEFPISYNYVTDLLDKKVIERLQLDRINSDMRLATDSSLFDEVLSAGETPDFRVKRKQVELGLECTTYSVRGRRGLNGLFRNIRKAIYEQPSGSFQGLLGSMVLLEFRTKAGESGKPFRANDFPSMTKLFSAMQAYSLQVGSLTPDEDGRIDFSLAVYDSIGTASFHANRLLGAAPDTDFFSARGFEMCYGFPSLIKASEAQAELQRLVEKHDSEGVDTLVVTCGGPSTDGYQYSTEELAGRFYLENCQPVGAMTNISSVLLHIWSTGEIYEVLQRIERVAPASFQTVIPRHRLYAPPRS